MIKPSMLLLPPIPSLASCALSTFFPCSAYPATDLVSNFTSCHGQLKWKHALPEIWIRKEILMNQN